jgi:hypothetical protein
LIAWIETHHHLLVLKQYELFLCPHHACSKNYQD